MWKTYKAGEEVDQNNSDAVAKHNLKLRKAMADSNKVLVKNMIAYQFVEDPNVDFDDEPLTKVPYDENLKADKCFRFLLGTSMVEENGGDTLFYVKYDDEGHISYTESIWSIVLIPTMKMRKMSNSM